MFDTHCHPTQFEDVDLALDAALAQCVEVVACAYHGESARGLAALAERRPELHIAMGLHPWHAGEPLAPLLDWLECTAVSAIGEIGLDYGTTRNSEARRRQREVFERQLDHARLRGLPVSVHSHKAVADTFASLRRFSGLRVAWHAFSGSVEQGRELAAAGHFIGLGATVTRPRARRIQRLAIELPEDCLLLETDSPSMAMEGLVAERVRPVDVARVAAAVAQLRGQSATRLTELTDANAWRWLGCGMTKPRASDAPRVRLP